MPLPILHRSLAAQGFAVARAVQWTLLAVSGVALAATGWLAWDSRMLDEQAAQYEASAARVQAANQSYAKESLQAGFDLSEARQQALPREVGFAKQLADQRAFSWTRMLSDLEEAVPPSVSLGSVALTPRESIVTLNGSALTLKDVTAFVNALENHRAFRDVVLSQHRVKESTKEEGHHYRQRPAVEFTLTVTYRPHPDLLPHSGGEGRSEREGKGGTRS